jgi:hypothetical protein
MKALNNGNVRARKKHVCDWCSETIKRGEIYVRILQVDSGDFYTTHLHTECNAAMGRELCFLDEIYLTGDFPRGLTDWEASEMGEVAKCS